MKCVYKTKGTYSTNIELDVENSVVKEIVFWGRYNDNLRGISRLVVGIPVSKVIVRLEGIRCEARSTSCPGQLCRTLHEMGL